MTGASRDVCAGRGRRKMGPLISCSAITVLAPKRFSPLFCFLLRLFACVVSLPPLFSTPVAFSSFFWLFLFCLIFLFIFFYPSWPSGSVTTLDLLAFEPRDGLPPSDLLPLARIPLPSRSLSSPCHFDSFASFPVFLSSPPRFLRFLSSSHFHLFLALCVNPLPLPPALRQPIRQAWDHVHR